MDEERIHDTFSGCLNFHKKYIPHILAKLEEMGIKKDLMFPDVELLRRECMND